MKDWGARRAVAASELGLVFAHAAKLRWERILLHVVAEAHILYVSVRIGLGR